jgi:hypothetical protein
MNDTTIYLIISFIGGAILGIGKILYHSKCHTINICWGGIHIERDIETEFKEDKIELENNNSQQNIRFDN